MRELEDPTGLGDVDRPSDTGRPDDADSPRAIELRPVESSHVTGIGYDAPRRELHVAYRGRRAIYKGVPPDVAEAVQDAPSTGQALHMWIRGNYEFSYFVPELVEPLEAVAPIVGV